MTCKRCGKCCYLGNYWQGSSDPLIKELAERFRVSGRRFKMNTKCLFFDEEDKVCLIQSIFGYDAKPEECKKYLCEDAK